jgi:hypothetical protein
MAQSRAEDSQQLAINRLVGSRRLLKATELLLRRPSQHDTCVDSAETKRVA